MSDKIIVRDVLSALRDPYLGQQMDDEVITEQAGYIPPHVQIENMILAGERLNESRGLYDFDSEDDIDESLSDPTRSVNYDMADASQSALAVDARLRDQEAAFKASQSAQDAPGEASKASEVVTPPDDKKTPD